MAWAIPSGPASKKSKNPLPAPNGVYFSFFALRPGSGAAPGSSQILSTLA